MRAMITARDAGFGGRILTPIAAEREWLLRVSKRTKGGTLGRPSAVGVGAGDGVNRPGAR